jgi:hypothetical protein
MVNALGAAVAWARAQSAAAGAVLNLVGPLGVGKSTILDAWAQLPDASGIEVVDSVDGTATVASVAQLLRDNPGLIIIAASRSPVQAQDGWSGGVPVVTLRARPWPDAEIDKLAVAHGLHLDEHRDLVVRWSGGIPLIAACLSRSLHLAESVLVPGAVADGAVRDVLARLRRECPQGSDVAGITALASVGESDEELLAQLTGGPGEERFTALAKLSIVASTRHGLAVVEPYRSLFDAVHQWRRPVQHRTALTQATGHRRQLLAAADNPADRIGLVRQSLFLTADPMIRAHLFPATLPLAEVRPMSPGDEDDVGRLVDGWARRRGLNRRFCETMLDGWLTGAAAGFHLVRRPDGVAVGMVNTVRLNPETTPSIEPLLQLHTEQQMRAADAAFAGFLICDNGGPAEYSALLHHVLAVSLEYGRLVVATPWPSIENLVRRLNFTHHGETRHDVYGCNRQGQIYSQSFARNDLDHWLDGLIAAGVPSPVAQDRRRLGQLVRQALDHLDDDTALARSPLVALPAVGTVARLREHLTGAVEAMMDLDEPTVAEAGRLLWHYYVHRRNSHDGVALRFHLSRATYFRRLDLGVDRIIRGLVGEQS